MIEGTAVLTGDLARAMLHGLRLVEYELLMFAAFWIVIGILDELAIDAIWGWLRLTGKARTHVIADHAAGRELQGRAAVFIPAWQEAGVIGVTIMHALDVWRQKELRIYVGCYRNDPATVTAAMAAAARDTRVRIVIHDADGPTTKADCLNRLYRALLVDEKRQHRRARMIILHDAEDMVHPAALALMDAALGDADLVQIPVRPEPYPGGHWISGHYCDEFTESHAKAMVVRDALGAALPSAGVGCALRRDMLERLEARRRLEGGVGPFEAECLTEDYELGWLVAREGGHSRFLRLRDGEGQLIATRSYFPALLGAAVRQKTRWLHGIAFQSWERLGWWGRPVDLWMAMRDRRGPLVALVLAIAYILLILTPLLDLASWLGWAEPRHHGPLLDWMARLCVAGLAWRLVLRFVFTTREYGLKEGARAIFRIPLANVIAIMAGRRAFAAYWRSLTGGAVDWDKTVHSAHPAFETIKPARVLTMPRRSRA